MCFIERETHNFNLKFGKFSLGQKQCSGSTELNLMKSRFMSNLCDFCVKNGTCCD